MLKNKLVAIINKEIDVGVAMNALAHTSIGFGAQFDHETLRLDNYQDKDGTIYPHISQMPFIILRGKSNDIRKAVQKAKEQDIHCGVFVHTMTGGSYQEQLDRTLKTPTQDIIFYTALLFGPHETVTQITKRFSLYI